MRSNIKLLFFILLLTNLLILTNNCYCEVDNIYEKHDQNMTIVINKQEHDRLIKYFFEKFDNQIMLSEDMRLYNSKWRCQEILLVKEYFKDRNNLGLRLFLKCQSDPEISIDKKADYFMFHIYTTNYYGEHDVYLEVSSYDNGLGLDCLLVDMDFNNWYDNKDKKERGDIYSYCPHLEHLPARVYRRDGKNY